MESPRLHFPAGFPEGTGSLFPQIFLIGRVERALGAADIVGREDAVVLPFGNIPLNGGVNQVIDCRIQSGHVVFSQVEGRRGMYKPEVAAYPHITELLD